MLTLVPNNLGLQYSFVSSGSAIVETGINISRFSLEVKPEVDVYLEGPDGQAFCNAVGDPMADLTIEGEIRGNTGVLAASFTTAFVPTNSTTYYGRTQGGFYLKSGSVEIERTSWKKTTTQFSSRFNIP